ncbi:MAG: pyridoxal-dependent decarboxylase [Bacteroidales bacterium]|nr:pyridoxal-dependent decarboxylase [Bacteroidales bacterium]
MSVNYKETLEKLFDIIINYIDDNFKKNNKAIIEYRTPSELKKELSFKIKKAGISDKELLDEVNNYLKYSVKTGDKQFFNQLYSGFNIPGFIGEIITALTNTSMYTFEVAPVATLIEKELINKMCNIVGFKNGSGIFVTGGSNANLIAMFSARNKIFQDGKTKGMYNAKILTAFVSDQAHYSFGTAANLLGIGSNNLIKIKSDENGKMIPQELEKEIIKSLQKGDLPFFIAATAGTTMLGAFDDFGKINEISKKYNCRFHIDGSFGGSILLSKSKKHLFKNAQFADSFAWDQHKLMNVPLASSVILFNENNVLKNNLTKLKTDYIFHENEEDNCDLGESSIQCGRRNDSLKLWLAWKYFGDSGYEKRINNLFKSVEYLKIKIIEHKNFELYAEVQTLTVCFRYNPGKEYDLNALNLKIREDLRKSGKSMVNYGYINNQLIIRFVAANADIENNDIDTFFNNFLEIAQTVTKNINNKNADRFSNNNGMAPNSR